MSTEQEIRALSAETLALSIVLGSVLGNLAKDKILRHAIRQGFDEAADMAQSVAIKFGKSAAPEHTIKALRIIEELRTAVLGNDEPPKGLV